MVNPNNYCVIMAGGIGSRFWPMSRTTFPKQFHDILGTGKTLIRQTFDRFTDLCPAENVLVVTNAQYKDLVQQQLPEIPEGNILCEPSRRNTAPCIAYATYKIAEGNPDARIVVAPSDHLIAKEDEFIRITQKALDQAQSSGNLVTLGIKPTRPDTGYGYIQFKEEFVNNDEEIRAVKTFTEKPELQFAKEFLEDGHFYWNSGIFIWTSKSILSAFDRYMSDIDSLFKEGIGKYNTAEEQDFINNIYPVCRNESIDYGVMEKAAKDGIVSVVLSDFGWSDLGTWGSLYTHLDTDADGNATVGENVKIYDGKNNMINSNGDKLLVLEGLEDYIVVQTSDVVMICRRDHEQGIKTIVSDLKLALGDRYL